MAKEASQVDLILTTPGGEMLLVEIKDNIDVRSLRGRVGLSQVKFSRRYGFSLTQLCSWEQGRARPRGATLAYLAAIEMDPDGVAAILARCKPPAKVKRRSIKPQSPPSPG